MREFLAVGIVALLSACAPATPPAKEAAGTAERLAVVTIGPEGYGPVKIGMNLAEAVAALGRPLQVEGDAQEPQACQIYPDGPVLFMFEQGRLTRVSLTDGAATKTAAGAGVGSTDAEVRAAYPNAVEEPAKYEGPPAHDLIVWTVPNERGIRYEVDASGTVARLHAGGASILYMEGCS